jgi:hypothetical protein
MPALTTDHAFSFFGNIDREGAFHAMPSCAAFARNIAASLP